MREGCDLPAPRKISPDFEAVLGLGGIHCTFSPFLVRSSTTCHRIMNHSSFHSDPKTLPRFVQVLISPCEFRTFSGVAGHQDPSCKPGGELTAPAPLPKYSSWSVSSSSSSQQPSSFASSPSGVFLPRLLTHPSLVHNRAGCPIPPHTKQVRPFSVSFGLPSSLAFVLACALGLFGGLPFSFGCNHG